MESVEIVDDLHAVRLELEDARRLDPALRKKINTLRGAVAAVVRIPLRTPLQRAPAHGESRSYMSPSISPDSKIFATPESEQDELEALRTSHRKLENVISVLRQEWQHTTQELEEVRAQAAWTHAAIPKAAT